MWIIVSFLEALEQVPDPSFLSEANLISHEMVFHVSLQHLANIWHPYAAFRDQVVSAAL